MRDIRLGKARLLLAQYMLDSNGPGLGAAFDLDRDVYTPLKMAAVEDGDAPITQVQFAIRFAEHKATVDHWTDQIITSSGYSPATFGRDSRGSAMTATEVDAREARSATTRARKIRTWSPALRQIIAKLLEVDAVVFNRGATPADGLRVLFPDAVQQTPEDRAQAAQLLKAAGAASTDTLVRMVNPDWDDVTVGDEVARILAENAALPDPYSFGG